MSHGKTAQNRVSLGSHDMRQTTELKAVPASVDFSHDPENPDTATHFYAAMPRRDASRRWGVDPQGYLNRFAHCLVVCRRSQMVVRAREDLAEARVFVGDEPCNGEERRCASASFDARHSVSNGATNMGFLHLDRCGSAWPCHPLPTVLTPLMGSAPWWSWRAKTEIKCRIFLVEVLGHSAWSFSLACALI